MINRLIQQLIDQAIAGRLIEKEDEIYVRNQILGLLHLSDFQKPMNSSPRPDLLGGFAEYACRRGIIEDNLVEKEVFKSKIINFFLARPSTVNRQFFEKYALDPQLATRYFYDLSKNSGYIQTGQNIEYRVPSDYGELDITINLAKPEKEPITIARGQTAKIAAYPGCPLCIENEGYAERARSNHRMIRLKLLAENWFFQYSPYLYYNEHCVVLAEKHTKMKMGVSAFLRLLAFVEQFPHYFLGSNADLPIVGGSILSHDHYQGGCYEFPMDRAAADWSFTMGGFPQVQCLVLKWPLPVIRLHSPSTRELAEAGEHILKNWQTYSDAALAIFSRSGDASHNTVTAVARNKGEFFQLDLVLRNNRTSSEHPLGIFHPHADVHHIKKENIGLIEVMGLAVLPGRLKAELQEVKDYILGKTDRVAAYHLAWAKELQARYAAGDAEGFVRAEAGAKFLRALKDAAVFKQNAEGQAGFKRFIETLG